MKNQYRSPWNSSGRALVADPYFSIKLRRSRSRGDNTASAAVAVRETPSMVGEGCGVVVGVAGTCVAVRLGWGVVVGLGGMIAAWGEGRLQAARTESMPKPRIERPARRIKSRRENCKGRCFIGVRLTPFSK